MEINKKLEGKTIKTANVDGFEVEIIFTDGSVFYYDASDGGYSNYSLRKGERL